MQVTQVVGKVGTLKQTITIDKKILLAKYFWFSKVYIESEKEPWYQVDYYEDECGLLSEEREEKILTEAVIFCLKLYGSCLQYYSFRTKYSLVDLTAPLVHTLIDKALKIEVILS